MDWLLAPIDLSRSHDISQAAAWHGRLMTLGWGVLAPLAVLVARFFKVMPGQDWPRELDNQTWWRSHWIGQSLVAGLTVLALVLVFPVVQSHDLHSRLGYTLVLLMLVQVLLGLLRGSKGGPTAPGTDGSPRGHHYDMTPRRRAFELLHKSLGYGVLVLAAVTILAGLWKSNAPIWMWGALCLWWVGLICVFLRLQSRGLAIDTYQAIWGANPAHPGNQRPDPGWGVRRLGEMSPNGDPDEDRRDRVRSH